MAHTAPFDIIAAPVDVYCAAVATAFPDVSAAPASAWKKLGTSGTSSQDEGGVTVAHSQTIDQIRVAGVTGPVKAVRSSSDLVISVSLLDISPEEYRRALNDVAVVSVSPGSGVGGQKKINIAPGLDVSLYALIIRGSQSTEATAMNLQYQVPKVYQSGSPSVTFSKGVSVLSLEFTALFDISAASGAEYGTMIMQESAAS